MADKEGLQEGKNYSLGNQTEQTLFHVKGMEHSDWGMKDRLSRIFNPVSKNSVMLAFDHGYILGPTAGLEQLELAVPKLIPHVDVLMANRGGIRTCIPPTHNKALALRLSAGSSVLDEDMSHEILAVDIEDAIRLNAACIAVQTFIGAEGQKSSIKNLSKAINLGNRYSIPVLGVVAVGKQMERTPRFFSLATRMLAEFGSHIIKSYYCDDFEKIVASCPVPIVIAGGKKIPEKDALEMSYRAIASGARGVDMGRNIFQAENPVAMAQAIGKIVHHRFDGKTAYEFYCDNK